MIRTAIEATLGVLLVCALMGCGTVTNLNSGQSVAYGGIAHDLHVCRNIQEGKIGVEGWAPGEGVLLVACYAIHLADAPLSAVGDTLTLPWTATSEQKSPEATDAPRAVLQP
jgi:uncharacterized protein YceK